MALSDPRALADFADLLKIKSIVWDVLENQQVDGLGSGDVLVTDLASSLWLPKITIDWMYYAEARQIEAALNSLRGARQFYLCDPIARFPASDPTGAILGDAEVVIHTIGDNNRSVSFSGLPAGYVLTPGDKWHTDFSTDPIRRGFIEMSEGGAADGTGVTHELDCFPAIWPGIDAGAAVTFTNPAVKAIIQPGSLTAATRQRSRASGITLTALQKL